MKVHILKAQNQKYNVIIHVPVITNNNIAGKPWKDCLLMSGQSGTSVLTVGTEPGQTTQSEMDDIVSGEVIEITANIRTGSDVISSESLTEMVDSIIRDYKNKVKSELKYFGYTQN